VRFAFTDDQKLFRDTLRGLLEKECTPAVVRRSWDETTTGRSRELWAKIAELGVAGLTVPESYGGLGLSELDLVLLLEECGRAALPEPILETTAVGAPLLAELGNDEWRSRWLPRVATGEARLAIGLEGAALVTDAHVADLLLLQRGDELHGAARDDVTMTAEHSVDGSRRLFRVSFSPSPKTRIASGAAANAAIARAFDRGALGAAAMLNGLARRLIDVTVEYVKVRKQFGAAIGSFQAVKHHLADALVKLEFARPVVYRAAYSLSRRDAASALHVSMAKAYASEAAHLASRAALQCHGAIGYSFEHDLHLFMKRAWALAATWGDASWHRRRVAEIVLDSTAPVK
jgi:alkylation response protein AidB-like acyl-CoA dehydrogenase